MPLLCNQSALSHEPWHLLGRGRGQSQQPPAFDGVPYIVVGRRILSVLDWIIHKENKCIEWGWCFRRYTLRWVSRQVGGWQDESDNSLDTTAYHTTGCCSRQAATTWLAGDTWLASLGLVKSESSVQPIRLLTVGFNVFYLVLTRVFTVLTFIWFEQISVTTCWAITTTHNVHLSGFGWICYASPSTRYSCLHDFNPNISDFQLVFSWRSPRFAFIIGF